MFVIQKKKKWGKNTRNIRERGEKRNEKHWKLALGVAKALCVEARGATLTLHCQTFAVDTNDPCYFYDLSYPGVKSRRIRAIENKLLTIISKR